MQAVYPMALTCNEFKRIQNDDEEVLRLIKLDADNAAKNGVNPYYEFEKKSRMTVHNVVAEEEENHKTIIKDVFITHYKCELNKVLDLLISDITDICTYMTEVMMPVTYYIQKTFAVVLRLTLEFCVQNFQPI